MKKIIIAIVAALIIIPSVTKAQGRYGADSVNCIKNLSYYSEYYKQKNYTDALTYWKEAYKRCPPTASQNLLIHGTKLMSDVADNSTGAEREEAINTVITLLDQRALYYPKNKATALNNKALYISRFYQGDNKKQFDMLAEIMKQLGPDTKSTVLKQEFAVASAMEKDGQMSKEEVQNLHTEIMELLAQKDPATDPDLEIVKEELEGALAPIKPENCEELLANYGPKYETNPDDVGMIKSLLKLMSETPNCTDNDLYLKAVTKLNAVEPSAKTCFYLYKLYDAKGQKAQANSYLEKILTYPDATNTERATCYLALANNAMSSGNRGKALDYCNKVVSLGGSTSGQAYMIIASIWAQTKCSGDEITSKANFWVAIDYLQKAKSVDGSLAGEANRKINQYSAYFPNAADAFMYNYTAGQSYRVSCNGMSATTTMRFSKK